jgi:hypothetical protein
MCSYKGDFTEPEILPKMTEYSYSFTVKYKTM